MADRQLGLTDQRLGPATASAVATNTTPGADLLGPGNAADVKNGATEASEHLLAAMEVNEMEDSGDHVGRTAGRMTVRVRGTTIDEALSASQEEEEHAGWVVATRRRRKKSEESTYKDGPPGKDRQSQQHRPRSPGKRSHATRAQITQRANIKLARTARMPNLPENDHKIIVRPRCGFALGRQDLLEFVAAMAASAQIPLEETLKDTVCPNVGQNIIVISTPSQERANRYDKVRTIALRGNKYEIFAYRAAPNDTVKGIIYGVPPAYTQADINACLLGDRNPTVLAAHRMGETSAIIILFEGHNVPQYVKFASLMMRCRLYKQHKEVCRSCGEIGHRKDVCPRPEKKVCFDCGLHNPPENHQASCKPRCKLCGGPHPSGTGKCRNKYKTPFVVRQRQAASKERPHNGSNDNTVGFDFPKLPDRSVRAQARQRSQSRHRGKSAENNNERGRSLSNNRATWATVTSGYPPPARGEKKPAQRKGSGPPPRGNREDNAGGSEVAALREIIVQLQETVKEQKEMINRLLAAQLGRTAAPTERAEETGWQLGSVQRPPTLTPAREPITTSPHHQPPSKIRKRAVTTNNTDEDDMTEEPSAEETNNGNAKEPFVSEEIRIPSVEDAGINYGVRIHKLGKRVDKQAGQIKALGEKVASVEANIKKEIAELKKLIIDSLAGKQHGTPITTRDDGSQ